MRRRVLASEIASRLRLTSLLERVQRRPALLVLVYHRILDPRASKYDPNVIEATPEQFDEHMSMLRKRHSVADPEELRELVANPQKIRHLRVAITFDDGYRDNYTYAFPILKSHGLKAIFFLPTHFVGTKHLPWWDQIAYVVRNSKRSEIALRYPRPTTVRVDPENPKLSVRRTLHLVTKDSSVDRERFMKELEEAAGLELPAEADEPQFFSWDEAAEMERAGMEMGSHTHTHRILASLSEPEQKEECKRSHDILVERKLKADCLAYPVGHHDSFSDVTIRAAREAGYRFAFSNFGGINSRDDMDPFSVRRLGMDFEDTAAHLRLRLALSSLAGREVW